MTTTTPPTETAILFLPPQASPAQIEQCLREFLLWEEATDRNRIFLQALQGMCLAELRKQHPEGRGGDRRPSAPMPDAPEFTRLTWVEYVRQTFGFSDDTAANRMKMWIAVRARIEKHAEGKSVFGLLTRSVTGLTPDELNLLKDVTHRVTDAVSQRALLAEARHLIQPHGAALIHTPGGPRNTGTPPKPRKGAELRVKDEILRPIQTVFEWWGSDTRVGRQRIPLWQHLGQQQMRELRDRLQAMLEDLQHALGQP